MANTQIKLLAPDGSILKQAYCKTPSDEEKNKKKWLLHYGKRAYDRCTVSSGPDPRYRFGQPAAPAPAVENEQQSINWNAGRSKKQKKGKHSGATGGRSIKKPQIRASRYW